jgi:hypothetical protein
MDMLSSCVSLCKGRGGEIGGVGGRDHIFQQGCEGLDVMMEICELVVGCWYKCARAAISSRKVP